MPYRAVLLDLEGTLFDGTSAIAGAREAVEALRRAGLAVRYVTNTTRLSRAGLLVRLQAMGLVAAEADLITPVSAAALWCRAEGRDTVLPLLSQDALTDLEGLRLVSVAKRMAEVTRVDAVLVGDLGPAWSYEKLNAAFGCLRDGATLVACQRNRYWMTPEGLALDAGPFVAALEYAAGTEAVVVGKPSAVFFRSALAGLEIEPREAVMVGDDAEVDVAGAIAAGLAGWLVRTGKYQPGDESRTSPWPECVLDSVTELPAALGIS